MHTMSEDYTGRQVDLEVLQHISIPAGTRRLSLTATRGEHRKVAGVQKAVQRYVSLLLSPDMGLVSGGVAGNSLMTALMHGTVANFGQLQHLFALANSAVLDAIRREDYNTEAYGEVPDDERIDRVSVRGMSIDRAASTISLSLEFETAAGTDYAYIVPISTGTR